MGLFVTVNHIYKKTQDEIVSELSKELKESYSFAKFDRIKVDNSTFEYVLNNQIYSQTGIYYLITQPHGDWATIVELNTNSVFLFNLTNALSKRLNTYSLSIHLYDGDYLYFDLFNCGEFLDRYNSDPQYFLNEAADKNTVIAERYSVLGLSSILPKEKNLDTLRLILSEGYWNAFDTNDLDENGLPNDPENYYVDEEERFKKIGNYLEFFKKADYPFADGHEGLTKLNLSECYLLKANKGVSLFSKVFGKD